MGCGESKHDVATGNTISHSKKSNNADTNMSKGIETIPETGTNDNKYINVSTSVQQPESENLIKDNESDEVGAVADLKDITAVNAELKEGDTKESNDDEGKEGVINVEEREPGRLITRESPNHYFSSRKDEEAIEATSEARSERSDYFSPRHETVKDGVLEASAKQDNAVEDKGLVEETSKAEIENGEPVINVNEENLVQEAEVVTTADEARILTTTGEENNLSADHEEHSTDSSTQDLKTN